MFSDCVSILTIVNIELATIISHQTNIIDTTQRPPLEQQQYSSPVNGNRQKYEQRISFVNGNDL